MDKFYKIFRVLWHLQAPNLCSFWSAISLLWHLLVRECQEAFWNGVKIQNVSCWVPPQDQGAVFTQMFNI